MSSRIVTTVMTLIMTMRPVYERNVDQVSAVTRQTDRHTSSTFYYIHTSLTTATRPSVLPVSHG